MDPTLYSKSSGWPTLIWKHLSDSSEYFDVEIGIINNDGTLSTMINGTTSYNRFVLSEQATFYLYEYAQSGKGIFASLKRYEGYGSINYNTVISYFYISLGKYYEKTNFNFIGFNIVKFYNNIL